MPRLSIITINYNNTDGLQKTMESVFTQTFTDYEYIIIDGGSNDGSKEYIESKSDGLTYWVSEGDKGIYNAQNKGILQAKGEYLLFLNSGDTLSTDAILAEASPFLNGTQIVYGDLIIKEPGREWLKKYNEKINLPYFYFDTLPHQGAFISRDLLNRCGGFDESLKITADWKFFLMAVCKMDASLHYLGVPVSVYDYTGLSSHPENNQVIQEEKHLVFDAEFPPVYESFLEIAALRRENHELSNTIRKLSGSRFIQFYFKIKNLFGSQ